MSGSEFRTPVTLEGRVVRLVPLDRAQVPGLAAAGAYPEIWTYLRIGPGRTPGEMSVLVDGMLEGQRSGEVLPFAVLERASERVVGMFRFFHIDRESHNVEVGTWLTPDVWRTAVNTDVKRVGLGYAFEEEGCHRVALKTDHRNTRSARAIERLGGVFEGVLRDHVAMPDGSLRSSAVYSILAGEWPQVRQRLDAVRPAPSD